MTPHGLPRPRSGSAAMVKTAQQAVVLPGRVVVTAGGVHRPPLLQAEVVVFVLAVLVLIVVIARSPAAWASLWPYLVALAAVAAARLMARRRHGPLGRPVLALRADLLVFSLPQDSRGQATVNWTEFQRLVVYGGTGRRIFRFERPGAEPVEVRPLWSQALEHGAVEFLRRHLPPSLRLTVEEPQTAFATLGGDGPAE